ncbi:MAG: hypothetical protein K6G89_05120 [Clostridia bacterium]|nr:hypothetical protein [Clostridia bacterium]
MARQHFYSRVPFRISMFNRADGLDTFACSEGIEREFIEKELNVVCDNKPTPNEAVLIRKGELPPVYCMFTAKDGTVVQSCTTYIPLDYTGERSTYMVHNLLFTPQEAESLFFTPKRAPINVEMFDHDIGHFDITSQSAKPLTKYPELDYKCIPAEDTAWLLDAFDSSMLQRLIYCVMSVACGTLKSVFLLLPDNSIEYAIKLFNTLYGIFPYHLRPQLSFASRLNDLSRYQSIKIKCLSTNFSIQPSKGAMLNFNMNQFTGMKDEDVQSSRQIVEFFYNMLENDAIRQEFLIFAKQAVKEVPALGQANPKMLNNLIFLFKCSSGLYEERLVLSTDDKMLEYYTIYEKYRAALSNEFRTNAAKSLRRYPETHTAIPPKLFAKIAKVYPTDLPAVRYIILEVVLELIHMDIMRDKLFQFVRANYASQSREEKDDIIRNISRVFYGGFLQAQILSFFEQIFLDESPEAQEAIMEKLLLSIRNKDVKEEITQFLATNMKGFTPQIRHSVYTSAIEHIQEGDDLASKLIDIINDNMPDEPDTERTWFELKFVSVAKAEQRKRTHPMIKLLATKQGYCSELILKKVFSEELGKKAYFEVVSGFCGGSLKDLALALKQAMPLFPDVDEDSNEKLFNAIKTCMEEEQKKFDLPSVITADKIITQCYDEEEEPFAVLFWEDFSEAFIAPALVSAIPDVFRYLSQPQIFDEAFAVVSKYDSAKNCDGARMMYAYKQLTAAVGSNDSVAMVKSVDLMPEDVIRRRQVSEFMKKNLAEQIKAADIQTSISAEAIISFLKSANYDFPGVYDKARQKLEEQNASDETPAKAKKNAPAADYGLDAINMVLTFGSTVSANCGEKMCEALFSDSSMLLGAFNSYIGAGKNQERKKLSAAVAAVKPDRNNFGQRCSQILQSSAKPSFFANLFKKK